jgi:hypothetical protein
MYKWWMHREIEVMKEAVAGDREVAPELEEHPGIRLEKSSDRLSMFFFLHNLRSETQTNYWCR